jgi:hypothetical protein
MGQGKAIGLLNAITYQFIYGLLGAKALFALAAMVLPV